MSVTADPLECPYCGAAVEIDPSAPIQKCPTCAQEFLLDTDDEEARNRAALEVLEYRATAHHERLDDRHIRAVQLELRSLYRSRTWMLVLGFACLGGVGQMAWLAARNWEQLQSDRIVAYAVVLAGLAMIGFWSLGVANRYRRQAEAEAEAHRLKTAPTEPPDFSTLGDGSQFANRLDQMHGRGNDANQP
ncbi:MAG TPA: hypothetical protein VGB55_04205 [Tepidisphaeraceae bacterium]|jgi:hypothetical protein